MNVSRIRCLFLGICYDRDQDFPPSRPRMSATLDIAVDPAPYHLTQKFLRHFEGSSVRWEKNRVKLPSFWGLE